MSGVPGGAGVQVRAGGAAQAAVEAHVPQLVADGVAGGIARQDPDLWGPDARDEAAKRLGWVDLPATSRDLVEPITALREQLLGDGLDRVVLCGMGGSSLAPEVITATRGVELTVLDGTDPEQVARVTGSDLARTVVVVSSKSGTTAETDSQRRAFVEAFGLAGIDPAPRMVVVTDPGSELEAVGKDAGYRAVFTADPGVGGRYSALTAFGLVPSGLAGVDVGALLDEAAAVSDGLRVDEPENPALVLGAALGGTDPLRDKVVLVDEGSGLVGLGDWAEQLVAESTGKQGTGLLPVVVASPDAPEVRAPAADVVVVRLVGTGDEPAAPAGGDDRAEVSVAGSLGGQLLLWEHATAVAGRLLGINPFDQPDVESAKQAARSALDSADDAQPAAVVDGPVEVRASAGLLDGLDPDAGADAAVRALLEALDPDRGYLAVMAYLDREVHAGLADVRDALARRTGRPVTFGWGPRFLHSTGQYHKGGPATGVYLQVTAAAGTDVPVPGREFGFGRLVAAQAAGDADVLARAGRPVLRLHLTDRDAGIARLHELLGDGGPGA